MKLPRFASGLRLLGTLVAAVLYASPAFALLDPVGSPVLFAPAPGSFPLVHQGRATPVVLDPADHAGVLRAAGDFRADVTRVTGVEPAALDAAPTSGGIAVIAGTIGRSAAVDHLVASGKIDVSDVSGRWEAFLVQVVEEPLPGLDRALVIAGADKRGTIFGLYTLSERIGVSPWFWWADVPVEPRAALHIAAGTRFVDAPVVKYRGIFINDEAPALTGWVHEKFGAFDHTFYRHVFELLLRLRANYLWPAMWLPRAFNDDDPENPRLADEYGIVMGTSHHEPMMRAHDEWGRHGTGPWDYAKNDAVLRDFWRSGYERVKDYESIVTLGMRGDGDEPMSEAENVALLERIVADQREIIAEVSGRATEEVPQVWALYKEVQGYYERGMRVPDDVTLLWCDDNWGNNRRLPTAEERARPGGAGVYYHFDYVGGPRNYKWINVTPLPKIWEQMHLAREHGADRIWIVNVGDIKPMEFPVDFFLTYAWNPEQWPYERLAEFSRAWAAAQFGPENAADIARLLDAYPKLNRHRTPELLAPDTYSLVHYREAERHLEAWRSLVSLAEDVNSRLAPAARDAFFQLVLYPVKASATVRELLVAAGLNRLYVLQGRTAANAAADHARAMWALDASLTDAYHALGGGHWNHMMSQSKFGYTYWQTPTIESMPALSEVRPNRGAEPALAVEGATTGWPVWGAPPPKLPAIDALRRNVRWFELFNRGDTSFTFTASASHPWLRLTPASGTVDLTTRIEVSADWAAVPPGSNESSISVSTSSGRSFTIAIPVAGRDASLPPGFAGFVESDGVVSIEAPNASRFLAADGISWKILPDHGRTLGGVTAFPVTADERTPGTASPRIEYDVFLRSAGEVVVEWHCAPSLDFLPGEGLRFGVSLGDAPVEVVKLDTWATLATWEKSVADSVRVVRTRHRVDSPGAHTLRFWMVTPGVVLQKVVVDAGGLKPSYLGPPESFRIP
ncbi:glycosyl hydrolase 115 family protein [Opitutales bacterium ASA1]|uniref:glycosyl hydrolase 115 family protein n=1 Tax=Congregicoccus parvus TaxID=3081749 RepID=UPI002B2EF055|nr:glycosyl hydrolase 115 family protein [Opitutales bacterium ASA1]